ncbi:CynX/NimT family MFS transporter [Actinophytocola sp. NPDC049390]|uniref:CynX/NimT family MFS transporter n=1 Tax=Actinophytocola sp. NPDC049390 TaxID=3363894 RepID=UPI0037A245E8
MSVRTEPAQRRVATRVGGGVLLGVAVVLAALNLRPAVTSVGPLLDRAQADLGASATWAGLLTTLPGVCFAVAGLAAPALARRVGIGPAVAYALGVLGVGLVVRVLDGPLVVLGGTLVASAGIALANVLIPVVVKDSFPARVGMMTGVYTAALQAGGALGSAAVPPMDDLLGGWRAAWAGWAVLAAVALVVWVLAVRGRVARDGGAPHRERGRSLLRNRLAWTVTIFFGLQAFIAYIVMGWFPLVLMDAGVSRGTAGLLQGMISLLAVPISLVVPAIAARQGSQTWWIVGHSVVGVAGFVGMIVAPSAAPVLWSVFVGIGMAVFSLALTTIALRARSGQDTASLSAMAQGYGYLIAAPGPLVFGLLHDVTAGWTVPLLVVTVVLIGQAVAGGLAGRNRFV